MIILCWSKQVINRNIISFLCSCIMINVYRACVIDFRSEVSSYDWINFDFDSNIDWISKHSHSSDIKDSLMKVMLVTSVFIRARNLNIFSKLLKMTSTVNDLKLNESSDMLMKQNMSILLSVTTLTKTDRFSNSQQLNWLHQVESSRSSRVFDSSRLDSSQNSWLEYSSWVEMFNSSIQVESKSWNRVSTRNSRLDSSRHKDR